MFYDEEQIKSVLNCKQCNERLDVPKILPCGATICTFCVSTIKIEDEFTFECKLCNNMHVFPSNGFPTSETILSLLSFKPNEIHRSDAAESLKTTLKEIQNKIDQITFGINNGIDQIKEYCIDLRTEVFLATELAIQQINELNEKLIFEINQYESDCIKAFEEKQHERETFDNLVEELKQFNNEWSKYLKQFKISDNAVIEANETAIRLNQLAEEEKIKLDDFIFNRNHLKFEQNKSKLLSTVLGTLDTSILSNQQMKDLMSLCRFPPDQRWKLLYRATTDGFGATDFHSKCDGYKNTLTIIKSIDGNVFGGFTEEDWDGNGVFKNDPNAFIFSYINKDNQPIIMKCIEPQYAIWCGPGNGPVFAGGPDINISDYSNMNTDSLSNLGYSYRHPIYALGSDEAQSFLAGSGKFQTTNIEIYCKV